MHSAHQLLRYRFSELTGPHNRPCLHHGTLPDPWMQAVLRGGLIPLSGLVANHPMLAVMKIGIEETECCSVVRS